MIIRQYVSLVKLSFLNSTYNIMSSTGAGKSVKRKRRSSLVSNYSVKY